MAVPSNCHNPHSRVSNKSLYTSWIPAETHIMTLRNTSGKFSLPTFGRKNTSDGPSSPSAKTNGRDYYDDDGYSPGREARNRDSRAGNAGAQLDAFGKKVVQSLAHQSLLPALANRDLRSLQESVEAGQTAPLSAN